MPLAKISDPVAGASAALPHSRRVVTGAGVELPPRVLAYVVRRLRKQQQVRIPPFLADRCRAALRYPALFTPPCAVRPRL
jgi:hypothetical protein